MLFENITTNGWVVLEPNDTLNTNGFSLCAAGVYIEKGADLLMTNNSRIQTNILLNYGTINETTGLLVSGENLTNNGTVSLGSQNFLNFTSIYNKGIITHNNFIRNATNFRLSFAGSGGGAAGFISNAEEPGGYTLATGGAAGVDTKGYNGGTPLEKLPSYSFNFSLLDSASGGAVENVPNCCGYAPGGFGVFPLVILSFSFKNNGVIANNGGNGGGGLNSYYSGNTGGGGGGVVEVLFHSSTSECNFWQICLTDAF
ncbi:hypothetical protein M1293_00840 [Candidatus Parvarchaeota archaeon]|nr:hypothetical protein [Candidatus Parvarchaeota archaeon]